ncbi:hypothetical protein V6N11_001309 [Hibiscus sabdariffa]|uniref:Uncharacterized protein n=1 Tax=Hibiscus sabdariffa TaxID=183260 RepID=A0ABR2RZD1_9ROSI
MELLVVHPVIPPVSVNQESVTLSLAVRETLLRPWSSLRDLSMTLVWKLWPRNHRSLFGSVSMSLCLPDALCRFQIMLVSVQCESDALGTSSFGCVSLFALVVALLVFPGPLRGVCWSCFLCC